MKINKQTILMSLGVFASIVAAVIVFYFVRGGSVEPTPSSYPEDELSSAPSPTAAPIFEVGAGVNACQVSFEIPCTPGITCLSKKAYENLSSNTPGNYGFTTQIATGGQVEGGERLVYQLNYENTGNTTIATATFSDVLPSGVSYVDGDTRCSYAASSKTVTCTLTNIAAGATGNVAFRVLLDENIASGTLTNSAVLTPSQGTASTCSLALNVPSSASPSLSPSPSSSVSPSPSPSTAAANLDCLYKRVYEDDSRNRAGFYYTEELISDTSNLSDGQTIVYSIGMKNHGGASASDVKITDVLSSNLTFVDADNGCSYEASTRTVTCNVGSLAAGVETTRSIRVRIGVSGNTSISNTAEVFSTNGQRDTCSVSVDASGKIVSPSPVVTTTTTTTTLPTAGVFEMTASTLGAGVLFLIVGAIGLLLL